jgi:hypothetical protein
MSTRYKTRQQLQQQVEQCHANTRLVALVSLIIGFILGKLS